MTNLEHCHGCGKWLEFKNLTVADGCPCNSPRGVNHGIVPKLVCTCKECNPEEKGYSRWGNPKWKACTSHNRFDCMTCDPIC